MRVGEGVTYESMTHDESNSVKVQGTWTVGDGYDDAVENGQSTRPGIAHKQDPVCEGGMWESQWAS